MTYSPHPDDHRTQDRNESHDSHEFQTDSSGWPAYHEKSLLEQFVTEVSNSLQVDSTMVQTAALTTIAASAQGLVDAEFPNGHTVPTSLMTIIIADSGEMKGAAGSLCFQPLEEFDQEKANEYEKELKKHSQEITVWDTKVKGVISKLKKATVDETPTTELEERLRNILSEKPCPPRNPKSIYKDSTPEAFLHGLHANKPVACLLSSEAGGLLNGRSFQDMTPFCSTWSGESSDITRKTTNSFTLKDARVSVCLMLQPGQMKRFIEKRGQDALDVGFFARQLFVCPPPKLRDGEVGKVCPGIYKKYSSRIKHLLEASHDKYLRGCKKESIAFTPRAEALWRRHNEEIASERHEGGIYCHEKSHAAKLMDNITRIAILIHVFEGYEGKVHSNTLEYAYRLGRRYSNEYLKNIAMEPEPVRLANLMVRDIRKLITPEHDVYEFQKSLFQTRGTFKLREIKNRDVAFEMLTRVGHLKPPEHYKDTYKFSDIIIISTTPEAKNGEEYTISELPLFKDQVLVSNANRGPVYNSRYELIRKQKDDPWPWLR